MKKKRVLIRALAVVRSSGRIISFPGGRLAIYATKEAADDYAFKNYKVVPIEIRMGEGEP